MKANYHTHTKRCRHATGTDREYVEAAIRAGLDVLGFADHCPWVYPTGFRSGMRMLPAEVDGYFSSLESLRDEYAKDIRIYIGFEAEYLPALIPGQEKLLKGYPLDYMILGQHFLGPDEEQVYMGGPFKRESWLQRYTELVMEGISTGKYLYVAHPDLPDFYGKDCVYRKYMLPLCRFLKEKSVPVEINVLGLATGRNYPSPLFLEIAREVGNTAVLGIDAHMPEDLLDKASVRAAETLCEKYGLRLIEQLAVPGLLN